MFPGYQVGSNGAPILLSVKLGTAGVALTQLYLAMPAAPQWNPLPAPTSANGSISACNLGLGAEVQGKYLLAHTRINFANVPADLWSLQPGSIFLEYTLEGGQGGSVTMPVLPNEITSLKGGGLLIINKIVSLT